MGRLKHVAEEGVQGFRQKHREMAQHVFDMCSTATHRFSFDSNVCLCVSNLKRGWQLKKTLPMNILSMWPWRACTKMVVVVFENDESDELVAWIQEVCAVALEAGVLTLATARLPNNAWHASVAKNTVHRCEVEIILTEAKVEAAGGSAPQAHAHDVLDGHFLVNLDGDNYRILGSILLSETG